MLYLTRLAVACIALVSLLALPQPTLAATRTKVVTETQINASYWVTHPARRAVTNRSVDLQSGKVVISETWTGRATAARQITVTLLPSVSNGRVFWTLDSATVDGQPASAELQAQINSRISNSWVSYVKKHRGAGKLTAVTITDDSITYTLETK